jgi:hypothetical protein
MGMAPYRLFIFAVISASVLAVAAVAHADETGHVSVDAMCADGRATPQRNLEVLVDGVSQTSMGMDAEGSVFVDGDGALRYGETPIGYGYDVPAGKHRVRISSDDCAPMEREVDIGSKTKIEASLPVTDPFLFGSVGAPNGFTMGLFAFRTSLPRSITANVHPTFDTTGHAHFDVDASSLYGVTFSGGYVHRFFVSHFDLSFGGASASAMGTHGDGTTESFDALMMVIDTQARIGVRVPLDDVAIEAGTGFGASLWIASTGAALEMTDLSSATKQTLDIPVWASVLVKPTCDLGVEIGAAYRFDPLDSADSTTMVDAGLVWEPNDSCDRAPSFEAT